MYFYITVAFIVVVVIMLLIFLHNNLGDDEEKENKEDFSKPESKEKIKELVKKDVTKAREVVKNDMKIFESMINGD